MEFDHLRFEVRARVAHITLDRPDKRNAISAAPGGTRDQLRDALTVAAANPEVGSVLLRGAGRAFSAGGDLTGNPRRETKAEQLAFVTASETFHAAVRACPLPTVAAVRGFCLGAGLTLATSCDFVVAAESATFGMPEGRIGLIGASALVPLIGRQWAKFLIMTGETLTAAQARDIGLVLAVVGDDDFEARTVDLAERLARMPRTAMELNKRAIDAFADAAGDAAGRQAALAHDAVTLARAGEATAPDGRGFQAILRQEGLPAMLAARAQQYTAGWLSGR